MKMLVCSIGSQKRESNLRFAAFVAQALSADTTLLGVAGQPGTEELRQALDRAAESLREKELPVQVIVEVGRAEDVVVDWMRKGVYDLVAMGALSEKRSRHKLFNSVAMRIVEQATSSVLVIKGERPALSRVLICTSGTERGHAAVWAGAALACGAGAEATVLHVVHAMPAMYTGLEEMEETLAELLQSDTEAARELRWATRVVRDECTVSEVKLRRGIVADEIIRESETGNHDLVVLGSSWTVGGLSRMLLGDLTREVVSRSHRPVLVVGAAAPKRNG